MKKVRLNNFLAVSIAAILLASTPVSAQDAQTHAMRFDIEAQPLPKALNAWAEQAGLQVIWPADDAAARTTSTPVQGRLDPIEALDVLLQNTGLTYSLIDGGRTVAIHPRTRNVGMQTTSYPVDAERTRASGIQLAEVEQPARTNASEAPPSQHSNETLDSSVPDDQPEEIVVTGSHIRGTAPAGSKVLVINRHEIERSGHGRVSDILETLPQNFSGVSEDFSQAGAFNLNRGSEIQLRGLGPGTTLTLVNGRRQPSGGTRGGFVDISSIASSAVERIEVLTDGASAIYGSDAIAGVVNIVTRKDFDGAETRARLSTAEGDANETQISQLLGKTWSAGNVLFGYQYYQRDELQASARKTFATNGDLTSLGGSDWRVVGGNPGTILDPDTFTDPDFAIPRGQNGTNLSAAALIAGGVNYADNVSNNWILPDQDSHTAFVTASQAIGERFEFFADGRYSRRNMTTLGGGYSTTVFVPSTNAFFVDPFGGSDFIGVAYNFLEDLGPQTERGATETYTAALGANINLSSDWRASVTGSFGAETNRWILSNLASESIIPVVADDSNPATALNVFGEGSNTNPATLAALRTSNFRRAKSVLKDVSAIVDGPLWRMPAGATHIALGADYSDESLDGLITVNEGGTETGRRLFSVGRHVAATFGELAVPLYRQSGSAGFQSRLDLSVAARYEDYSDAGSTFNPKLGLAWAPLQALKVRGTWGTAFRAPPFYQTSGAVGTVTRAFRTTVPDPRSTAANGRSTVLILSGANPDLQEETATVWTAGVDIAIPMATSPKLSLTYFDIDYRDKIGFASPQNSILTLENQWQAVITRSPSAEQISAVCGRPGFTGSCAGQIAAILDLRSRNLASVEVNGIDLDLSQSLDTPYGAFGLRIGGSYLFKYGQAVTDTTPSTDVLDTVSNPLALRLRANVSWNRLGWHAALAVNHSGSYEQPGIVTRSVSSFNTADLNVGYEIEEARSWVGKSSISLSAVNLFDKSAPFVDQFGGYDYANSTVLGRLLSVQFSKAW